MSKSPSARSAETSLARAASSAGSLPRLQPNSGLPEFGRSIGWPKSETSDFGWRAGEGGHNIGESFDCPLPVPPPQAGEGTIWRGPSRLYLVSLHSAALAAAVLVGVGFSGLGSMQLAAAPKPKQSAQTQPAPPAAQRLGIGRAATAAEIAGWDIDIRPDGHGLPAGKGSVKQGEPLYLERCAACHGEFGESSGRWPIMMGGAGTLGKP